MSKNVVQIDAMVLGQSSPSLVSSLANDERRNKKKLPIDLSNFFTMDTLHCLYQDFLLIE